jgi:hypothetical protein
LSTTNTELKRFFSSKQSRCKRDLRLYEYD